MAEKLFQVGVKAYIRNDAGDVLLVRETKHEKSYWDIPGGRMEPDESFFDTLRLELREEVSIQAIDDAQQLTTVVANHQIKTSQGPVGLTLVIYSVRLRDGDIPRSGEEGLEVAWRSPQEASELLADKYPALFCEQVARAV